MAKIGNNDRKLRAKSMDMRKKAYQEKNYTLSAKCLFSRNNMLAYGVEIQDCNNNNANSIKIKVITTATLTITKSHAKKHYHCPRYS